MIQRFALKQLNFLAGFYPVIAILGPRQIGKTTLAQQFAKNSSKPCIYLDLEKRADFDKLNHAEIFLEEHTDKCIIIDEVQLRPELFSILRPIIDQYRVPLQFILLGSADPGIVKGVSESLTGRITFLKLHPFSISELKGKTTERNLHFLGGFPPAILASGEKEAKKWLDDFIFSYTESNLQRLGLPASPLITRRFWEMIAWLNGTQWNSSSIGKSLSLSYHTVNNYLDFFEGAYLVRKLPAHTLNQRKRIVKNHKVYLADTGVLHRLLRMDSYAQLLGSPILGFSWECFVINQILSVLPDGYFLSFYKTYEGAEIDLVIEKGIFPEYALEIKFGNAPKLSKGFYSALQDLKTKKNFVIVHDPNTDYLVKNELRVCGLKIFLNKYLEIKN